MKIKISVIVIIALLFMGGFSQMVNASGGVSSNAQVSVNVISLTQELNSQEPVVFEKSQAEYTTVNGKTAMMLEDAGSIEVNTNIGWKLFAAVSNQNDMQIYIRVGNDGNRSWLPVNNQPVLSSNVPGDFKFSWDILVVADNFKDLQNFEINFDLQAR